MRPVWRDPVVLFIVGLGILVILDSLGWVPHLLTALVACIGALAMILSIRREVRPAYTRLAGEDEVPVPHFKLGDQVLVDQGLPGTVIERSLLWVYSVAPSARSHTTQIDIPEHDLVRSERGGPL